MNHAILKIYINELWAKIFIRSIIGALLIFPFITVVNLESHKKIKENFMACNKNGYQFVYLETNGVEVEIGLWL